jgi:hypothetical protein
LTMKHRNSHFAVGYWSRLRHGRGAPDQADIDPKALKRLLPFVFLLDARQASNPVYRLAGSTLCERYGGELRGRNFLSIWDPGSRGRLTELLREALSERMPACLTSIGATEDCRMVEIETVLLPITFGGHVPERFLGVAQVLTDVTPLAGRPISFERLVASKLIREADALQANDPPLPPPGDRGHPRAPHLRLVASRASSAADPLRFDLDEAIDTIGALCSAAGLWQRVPVKARRSRPR